MSDISGIVEILNMVINPLNKLINFTDHQKYNILSVDNLKYIFEFLEIQCISCWSVAPDLKKKIDGRAMYSATY